MEAIQYRWAELGSECETTFFRNLFYCFPKSTQKTLRIQFTNIL